MRVFRTTVLSGLLLVLAQGVMAAPVAGLYQVREPLSADTEDGRNLAFSRAFATLVQRMTGRADDARAAGLAAAAQAPQNLALGYTFQEDELQVSFDAASVLQALREAGLPVWGSDRPVVLLWWVQEGLHGRNLLGEGNNRSLNLQQAALNRGLPARFPLADLNELMQADKGWDGAGQVQTILQNYGADILLVVESSERDGAIGGRWQLLGLENTQSGSLAGDSLVTAADTLFLQLAAALAQEYAVLPGQGNRQRVRLQGLDIDGMLAAEKALQVFGAQLVYLQGETGVWDVTALPEQLRSQLGLYKFRELPQFDDGAEQAGAERVFVR